MPSPVTIETFEDVQYLMDALFDQGLGILQDGVQMAALQEFKSLSSQRSILSGARNPMSFDTDIISISMPFITGRPVLMALQGDGYYRNYTGVTQTPVCRPYVNGVAQSYQLNALENSDANGRQSLNGTERNIRNMLWLIAPSELPTKSGVVGLSIRDPSGSTDGSGSSYWVGGNLVLNAWQP